MRSKTLDNILLEFLEWQSQNVLAGEIEADATEEELKSIVDRYYNDCRDFHLLQEQEENL